MLLWLCLSWCCFHQPSPRVPANAPPPGTSILSNGGTYRVIFQPLVGAVPQNEIFDLEVHVLEAGERILSREIELAFDAEMPAHQHGMVTEPKVEGPDGGRFLVTGVLLHMPGIWQLYFDITRSGRTERAQVAIEIE